MILGYRYDNSPICVGDDSAAPPDSADRYVPTSRAGARAPHVWLAPDHSILDVFGRAFVLLRFSDTAIERLVIAASRRGVPLAVSDLPSEEAASLYARALVLVRPDGHVAWRGDRLPTDCEGLIDRVRGAVAEVASENAVPR